MAKTVPAFRWIAIPLLAAVGSFSPSDLLAQVVVVDQGSFELFLDGERVGTEDFLIRRSGAGESERFLANASLTIEISGTIRSLDPILEVTAAGLTPTLYQLKSAGEEELEVRLWLPTDGRRFLYLIESPAGVERGEHRAYTGTIVLEEWSVHQHYFLALQADSASSDLHTLYPSRNATGSGTTTDISIAPITVDGTEVEAIRVTFELEGDERTIWVDEERRILQLEIPSRGYLARRRSLPPSRSPTGS